MSSASLAEHVAIVGLGSAITPLLDTATELQDAGVHDAASAQIALRQQALTDVCVFFPGRGEHAPDGFEVLTHTLGGAALAPQKDRRVDEPCFCVRRGNGASVDAGGSMRAPIGELAIMESDPRASSGPHASTASRAPPGFELVFKSPGGRDADLNRCLRSAGFGVSKASATAAPPLFMVLRRLGVGLDSDDGTHAEADRFHQRGVARPLMELGLLRARVVKSGGGHVLVPAPQARSYYAPDAASAAGAPFMQGDSMSSYEPAEDLPSGWSRMARPLPLAVGRRSEGDWSVGAFLAFRRAPAVGLCDLRYAPEVLLHYPRRHKTSVRSASHSQTQAESVEPATATHAAAAAAAAASATTTSFALPAAELPLFCFPYGCELRRCSIDELPSPRVFSFALTLADGSSVFATCLMAHEQVSASQMAQLEAQLPLPPEANARPGADAAAPSQPHGSSKAHALLGLSTTKDSAVGSADSTNATAHENPADSHVSTPIVYAQVCVVLLTEVPWLETHRALLAQLHQRAQILASDAADPTQSALQAGAWVSRVLRQLHKVIAPPPGAPPLLLQLDASESTLRYGQTVAQDFPLLNLRLSRLFGCLTPRAVVHVLALLLLECRVVLLSRSHSLPSDCTMLLRSLLFPCQWQGACIPRLPYALWDVLDVPGACLVGVTARPSGSGQSSSFGVADILRACEAPSNVDSSAQSAALYVVDLDKNLVASHQGSICFDADVASSEVVAGWLPSMPRSLHEPLVRKLKWACAHFGVEPSFESRIDVDAAPVCSACTGESSSIPQSDMFNFEVVVRCAVLQMHAELLKDYQKFLTPPTVATVRQEEWSGSAEDWFDVDAFVASWGSKSTEEAAFVRAWSGTQLFAHLVHDLTEASSRDESLLFFEQFCAKNVNANDDATDAVGGDDDDKGVETGLRCAVSNLGSCRQITPDADDDAPIICIGSSAQASAAITSSIDADDNESSDSASAGALQSWWHHVSFNDADTDTDNAPEQNAGGSAANVADNASPVADPGTVSAYPACRSTPELLLADEKLQSIESCGSNNMGANERSLTLHTLATSLRELHEGGLRRKTTKDTPSRRASKTKKGAYLEKELNDCWDATLSSGSDDDNPAAAIGITRARFGSGHGDSNSDDNIEPAGTDLSSAGPTAGGASAMRRMMEPQERLDALLSPARMCLRDVYGTWFLLLPRWFASKAACEREVNSADIATLGGSSAIATACVVEMALGAVHRMRRKRVQPDEAMYRALLWTCGQSGPRFSRDAVGLFKEMRNDGITPNVLTYGLYSRSVVNYHRFYRRKQVEMARKARSQVGRAQVTHGSESASANTLTQNVRAHDLVDEAARLNLSTEAQDARIHDLIEDFVGATDYQLNELQGLGIEWRRSVRMASGTHRGQAEEGGPECADDPAAQLPLAGQHRTLWSRATSVFRTRSSTTPETSALSTPSTLQHDGEQKDSNNATAHSSDTMKTTLAPVKAANAANTQFDGTLMPSIADLHPAEPPQMQEPTIIPDVVSATRTGPTARSTHVTSSVPADSPMPGPSSHVVSVALKNRVLAMWIEGSVSKSAGDTAHLELEEQATARWLSGRSTGAQPSLCIAIGTVQAFRNAQTADRSQSSGTGESGGSNEISQYRSEYLSSVQMRRQLETIVQRLGNSVLDGPQLHGTHAHLYWNLIWHCNRVSLPVPLARCFTPLHAGSAAADGTLLHGQASPISVIVTNSRARAFEWAARFRSRTTGPPRSALSCVCGMEQRGEALSQSDEDKDFDAAGLAAVLSALCSPVRPIEQAVTCFLSLRMDARARKGCKQGSANVSSVSVFERPMYLVLLRIVQGFNIMDTVLPTDEKGITALPGQHSGVMSERVLLPAFEQAFVDTLAIGASGGLGADCWHQFDWELDVPAISMAAIASRSIFGVLC